MASHQTSFAAALFFQWSTGVMARPQGCVSLMSGVLPLWQWPSASPYMFTIYELFSGAIRTTLDMLTGRWFGC